jgi:hypothetical protein
MTETVIPLSENQIQITLASFNRRAGSLSAVSVDWSLEAIMAFLGLRSADHPEHPHRKPILFLGRAPKGPTPQTPGRQADATNRTEKAQHKSTRK